MGVIRSFVASLGAALMLTASLPALAQTSRSEVEGIVKDYIKTHPDQIEQIVKDYLAKHPEAVQQALAELVRQRLPSATAAAPPPSVDKKALVRQNAAALFSSAHQVTLGNLNGDVTLVEFFDYSCGFCKRALNDTMVLLKSDANLKIVLKDFPILGQGSLEAARVGIAVRMQDPTGAKYLDFYQRMLSAAGPANRSSALAVAGQLGLDNDRLNKDIDSDEVRRTLDESFGLAQSLGLTGTPSYVIGENVVVGAVGLAALKENVQAARR